MTFNTATSVSVAPIFLTRPFLFLGIKPIVVSAITTFLQEFLTVSGGESQTLELRSAILPSLSEIVAYCNTDTIALIKAYFGDVPAVNSANVASAKLAVPIPLALACHFFGLVWNEWFLTLGGSEFELVLWPTCVYVVKKSNGCIGVVWTDTGVMRSSMAVPLRTASPLLPSPIDASDTDSNTSRPSSRSSNYSTFSFSSNSSVSSQSSIGSFDTAPKPTYSYPASYPTQMPIQTSFTRVNSRSEPTHIANRKTPKPLATPVAPSKTAPTKYLYQGGVSTVLTGGVMLGNPNRVPSEPQASPAQSLVYIPPHLARGSTEVRDPAGPSDTWRRTTPVAA